MEAILTISLTIFIGCLLWILLYYRQLYFRFKRAWLDEYTAHAKTKQNYINLHSKHTDRTSKRH
jgi:hypothetical protein